MEDLERGAQSSDKLMEALSHLTEEQRQAYQEAIQGLALANQLMEKFGDKAASQSTPA